MKGLSKSLISFTLHSLLWRGYQWLISTRQIPASISLDFYSELSGLGVSGFWWLSTLAEESTASTGTGREAMSDERARSERSRGAREPPRAPPPAATSLVLVSARRRR